MNYLFYLIIFGVGIFVGRITKQNKSNLEIASDSELKEIKAKSQKALTDRTKNRKQKIMAFLKSELKHQKQLANCQIENKEKGITRKDVQNLLAISHSTALKYLNELESENKIKQIGTNGKNVFYTIK